MFSVDEFIGLKVAREEVVPRLLYTTNLDFDCQFPLKIPLMASISAQAPMTETP